MRLRHALEFEADLSPEQLLARLLSGRSTIWQPAGERHPEVDMVQNAITSGITALAPLHPVGMGEYPVGA
jgi:hypothetical protein